ncbi:uncharacterized protein KRP23_1940 [Phytophthora ramorum]|uniref:uncharacterized protein n=1 Tax=Phytophthora ramorum TaxID=164328 RepID=UPI00309A2F12|nr:hypothetical protein KRP23_1940 [Phytophthora ramorum]
MKTLFGVILEERLNLRFEIEEDKTVGDLQRAIQRSFWEFRAENLKLYLGKKDGRWLQNRDPDVQLLTDGKLPDAMMELVGASKILDPQRLLSEFNFRDTDDRRPGEFHFLLEFPKGYKHWKLIGARRRGIAKQRRKAKQPQSRRRLSFQPLRKWFGSVFSTKKVSRRPKKAPWL